MTKTAAEVADRALEVIGVKPVGQSAAAEDATVARETYTALLSELSERDGMAFEWAEDETPEWAFMPLAELVAARIGPIYGVQRDGLAPLRVLRRHVFQDDRVPGQSVDARFY